MRNRTSTAVLATAAVLSVGIVVSTSSLSLQTRELIVSGLLVVLAFGLLVFVMRSAAEKIGLGGQRESVDRLISELRAMDAYTPDHSERVVDYVAAILDEMPHLPRRTRRLTLEAAHVHDIGKIGVPESTLRKPGPLTEAEWQQMRAHPEIGARLVSTVKGFRDMAPIIRHHHERWDGAGYPDRIRHDAIPVGARIIAVADAFDAMTTDRPYRAALTQTAAVQELRRSAGTQFDPTVVDAFLKAIGHPPAPVSRPVYLSRAAD